jgi:acyl-CoA thioesterase-1
MHLRDRETWLFAGDSITQGVEHTHGERCWVELFAEYVRRTCDRPLDIVVNTGVSGWTTRGVLGEFDHLVGRWAPTVVSISLGTNDASLDPAKHVPLDEFRSQLSELVTRSAGLGARPDVAAYSAVCRVVAEATGALLVDHEAHWRAAFADVDPVAWLDDPIHPNPEGHRQMARLLIERLGLGTPPG